MLDRGVASLRVIFSCRASDNCCRKSCWAHERHRRFANLPLGLAAVEKGKAVGAKTQRERDFINAMTAFYTDFDKVDHSSRVLASVNEGGQAVIGNVRSPSSAS